MTEAVLAIRDLTKTFNGRAVLKRVSLDINAGEVHGLVGANGSGKSTLIKIISGFHSDDSGAQLTIAGHDVHLPSSPKQLARLGVKFVHQDLGLVPNFTISENFALLERTRVSLAAVPRHRDESRCQELLTRFGLELSASARVEELTITEQVMIAVMRTMYADRRPTKVLVLDEATSGLPPEESAAVLRIVRDVADQGVGVLFVSHRLDEILDICDRTTVLRDGTVVTSRPSSEFSSQSLAAAMFGTLAAEIADGISATESITQSSSEPHHNPVALQVSQLRGGTVREATFSVHKGEIVAITGLLGCGVSELGRLLFGADRATRGKVAVGEHLLDKPTPRSARSSGVAYVPASRDLSVLKLMTLRDNLMLPDMSAAWRTGLLRRRTERRLALQILKQFGVVPAEPDLILATLSGGNQQKVALAKALQRRPDVLILDDPCRGVDISARRDIYQILRDLASNGLAVLLLTSELEDVEALCDRVIIMHFGVTGSSIPAADLTMTDLTNLINGTKEST